MTDFDFIEEVLGEPSGVLLYTPNEKIKLETPYEKYKRLTTKELRKLYPSLVSKRRDAESFYLEARLEAKFVRDLIKMKVRE